MNRTQFQNEVINSSLSPLKFVEIYDEFKNYQDLLWNVMREFHNICYTHNIHYQLAYGTLLGVIRDEGQIPWDYDIDVIVPFSERNQLVDALQRNLSSKYYIDCLEVNKKYNNVILRISPCGYNSEVLHVDVFFFVGIPDNEQDYLVYKQKMRDVCSKLYYKNLDIELQMPKGRRTILEYFQKKIRYLFYSTQYLKKEYFILAESQNKYNTQRCANANRYLGAYTIPTKLLMERSLIQTPNGAFFIPSDYDLMLRLTVSEQYEEILPLERRLNEMMYCYNKIKKYGKKQQSNKASMCYFFRSLINGVSPL